MSMASITQLRPRADGASETEASAGGSSPATNVHEFKDAAKDMAQARIESTSALLCRLNNATAASRMLAALTLFSDKNFPVKDLLGAIPFEGLKDDSQTIVRSMANLGFMATRVELRNKTRLKGGRPVLINSQGTFYALFQLSSSWMVCDGAGNVKPVTMDLLKLPDAEAWSFEYDSLEDKASALTRSHSGYTWMRALMSRFPYLVRSLSLATAVLALTGILFPLLVSSFFGQVISLASLQSMPYLVAGFLLLIMVEAFFLIQRSDTIAYVANRLEYLVSTSSFRRILQITPFISERAPITSQAARLKSFENIRDFIAGPAFVSIADLPASLISLMVVGLLAPSVIFIPLGAIILFAFIFMLTLRKVAVCTSIAADEATELQRLSIETFDKLDLIRNAGMQETWVHRIEEAVDRDHEAQMTLRLYSRLAESASSFIYTSAVIGVLAGGAYVVWGGGTSSASLLAITILSLRALLPFHSLCLSVQRFEQMRRSFTQINTLMDLDTESTDDREKNAISHISGRLSFVNIGFRINDTRPVFIGLDLEIEPGDIIGIYGANGTGKTTLFKMLLGMQDLALGTIRLDGVDIRQLPLAELRRRVSYVPQRPQIFPGSLRQNLLNANPLASEEQMMRVLDTVGLTEKIAALPAGLDHKVVSGSNALFSQDFRFRFALAYALLINSDLFLIDEIPNQILDGDLGELMHRLLRDFRGTKTVLFVSHRTDFLSHAERVIAMRYGKIPLVTRPEDLLGRTE